jgi:hypothetical protein
MLEQLNGGFWTAVEYASFRFFFETNASAACLSLSYNRLCIFFPFVRHNCVFRQDIDQRSFRSQLLTVAFRSKYDICSCATSMLSYICWNIEINQLGLFMSF